MLEKSIKEVFLEECNYAIGFLVTDYGFTQPEIKESNHQTIEVTYFKRDIAIELSLDVRDVMYSLRIIRLEKGKKPSDWRVNKQGKVVAEYLTTLLIQKGVRDFKYEEPPGFNKLSRRQAAFRKGLVGEARLLRLYGQDILNGSASIFSKFKEPGDNF